MDGTESDTLLSAKVVCERLKAQRTATRHTAPYVRIPSSEDVARALQTLHECKCVLASLNPTDAKPAHTSEAASAAQQLALELRLAQRLCYISNNQQRHMRHVHKLREALKRMTQLFAFFPPHKVLEPFAEAALVARSAGISAATAAAAQGTGGSTAAATAKESPVFDEEAVRAVAALKTVRVPASGDSAGAVAQLRSLQLLAQVAEHACEDVVASTDSELVLMTFFIGLAIISECTAARLAAYARYCRETMERACAALMLLQDVAAKEGKSAGAPAKPSSRPVPQQQKKGLPSGHKPSAPATAPPADSSMAGKMALLMCGIKKPKPKPKKRSK